MSVLLAICLSVWYRARNIVLSHSGLRKAIFRRRGGLLFQLPLHTGLPLHSYQLPLRYSYTIPKCRPPSFTCGLRPSHWSAALLVPHLPAPWCQLAANQATVSPEGAKALLNAGYVVRVEKCPNRIYKTEEFEAAGAEIVETGSWVNAPKDNIILGLKELETDGSMLGPPAVFQKCGC